MAVSCTLGTGMDEGTAHSIALKKTSSQNGSAQQVRTGQEK